MENLGQKTVGILKHKSEGYAEELLVQILETAGLAAAVIDPLDLVYGDRTVFPHVVLARCELSSFSENAFQAYLTYFSECVNRSIPVINPREFLLLGQDKYLSHAALESHLRATGISDSINPPTWQTHSREKASRIALSEIEQFNSVVIKRPCSGRGDGVYLAESREELESLLAEKFLDKLF